MTVEPIPITAEWLALVGFKWHQLDRQPEKHWLLWVGFLCGDGRFFSPEDLGIELAPVDELGEKWFCWLRSDTAHRYHRFLHVRHLRTQEDLIRLFEGLTGHAWNPLLHRWGQAMSAEWVAYFDKREQRLDQQLARATPWSDLERDPTAGGALPEHREAYDEVYQKKVEGPR